MDKVSGRLYIFFEEPFWIGIFEREENKSLFVCKVTFKAEPTNAQIYDFLIKNYLKLRFSPSVQSITKKDKKNPKRIQREVHRQMNNVHIGTKSMQALKLQYEQMKKDKKARKKQNKEEEKKNKFNLRKQKKKEKHRGK